MPRFFPLRLARLLLPFAAGLAVLAGCSDRSGYPSLGVRPIERTAAAEPVTDAGVPPGADAVRDARAATLTAEAVTSDAAFAGAAAGSCRTVVAGLRASEGSEAWLSAQQALAALDAARGATRAAAAELDQMLIDANGDAGPTFDTSRIAAAAAQVGAIDTAEEARVEAIRGGDCRG